VGTVFSFPSQSIGQIEACGSGKLFVRVNNGFEKTGKAEARGIVVVEDFQGLALQPRSALCANPEGFNCFRSSEIIKLNFPGIEALHDSSLQCLRRFSSLQSLDLENLDDIDGKAVDTINSFGKLSWLFLTQAKFSTKDLSRFDKLTNLMFLSLNGFREPNIILEKVRSSPKLQRLSLIQCETDKRTIAQICSMPCLRRLEITDNSFLTDEDCKTIARAQHLESIQFYHCTKLTPGALSNLSGLRLNYLRVSGANWDAADIPSARVMFPGCEINHGSIIADHLSDDPHLEKSLTGLLGTGR
jgi:hypothetical protein